MDKDMHVMYAPAFDIVFGPALVGSTSNHQSPPSIIVCHITEHIGCFS